MNKITSSKLCSIAVILVISIMAVKLVKADDSIRTEIITLSMNAKLGPYFYLDKNEVKQLPLSRHGVSSPITYKGSTKLQLFLNKPSPEAIDNLRNKKNPQPKPDLEVNLSQKTGRTILLFSQVRTTGKATPSTVVRPYAISNNTNSKGDYLVFNLSKNDAFISLDKKTKQIKPSQQVTLSSPSWKKKPGDLAITLAQKKNNKLEPVYNSIWGHQPKQRAILFIYDHKSRLAIRRYYDHPGPL